MSYTYTSTGRHFIENPYTDTKTTTSYTTQQLLGYISTTDMELFDLEGNLILKEYTIDGKYFYPVIAFSHDILTSTGKIKKSFKQSLENKSFEETETHSDLSETTYDILK